MAGYDEKILISARKATTSPRQLITIVRIYTVLFWFSNSITLPYISTYSKQIGVGSVLAGIIVSAYSMAPILIRLPLGAVAASIRRQNLLVTVGAFLMCTSMLGIYFAKSVEMLIMCRLLHGLAASTWVCVSVIYSSYFSGSDAVVAMSHLSLCSSLGSLSGYLLGGLVSNRFGLKSIFLLAGFSAFIGFCISFAIKDGGIKKEIPKMSRISMICKSKFLLLISFAGMMNQFIQGSTMWGFTPRLAEALNGGALQISLCSLLYSTPGLFVAVWILPRLVSRLGLRKTAIFTTGMLCVCCILLPLGGTLSLLYATCFLQGAFHSLSYALLMSLSIQVFPEDIRMASMGYFQSFYSIGLLLGPIVTGFTIEYISLKMAFVIVGLIAMSGPLLIASLYERAEFSTLRMFERQIDDGVV